MSETTCWTVICAAAAGDGAARDLFAKRYAPVVRAYLAARWRGGPLIGQLDDAVQEVFVAFLKPDGGLERADAGRPGGFRPFLYGIARNVARRFEHRPQPAPKLDLDALPADDPSLSRVFDRAWAAALLRAAADRQAENAHAKGEAALRRVELLRLRFSHGLPIRTIAARWGVDAAKLHHEYATAREEFRAALKEIVTFHQPGRPDAVERAVAELLGALQ